MNANIDIYISEDITNKEYSEKISKFINGIADFSSFLGLGANVKSYILDKNSINDALIYDNKKNINFEKTIYNINNYEKNNSNNEYSSWKLIFIDNQIYNSFNNKKYSSFTNDIYEYPNINVSKEIGFNVFSGTILSNLKIDTDFYRLGIHELGHVLSLKHCFNNKCIMGKDHSFEENPQSIDEARESILCKKFDFKEWLKIEHEPKESIFCRYHTNILENIIKPKIKELSVNGKRILFIPA
jgi:hypothetical protein